MKLPGTSDLTDNGCVILNNERVILNNETSYSFNYPRLFSSDVLRVAVLGGSWSAFLLLVPSSVLLSLSESRSKSAVK